MKNIIEIQPANRNNFPPFLLSSRSPSSFFFLHLPLSPFPFPYTFFFFTTYLTTYLTDRTTKGKMEKGKGSHRLFLPFPPPLFLHSSPSSSSSAVCIVSSIHLRNISLRHIHMHVPTYIHKPRKLFRDSKVQKKSFSQRLRLIDF